MGGESPVCAPTRGTGVGAWEGLGALYASSIHKDTQSRGGGRSVLIFSLGHDGFWTAYAAPHTRVRRTRPWPDTRGIGAGRDISSVERGRISLATLGSTGISL